MSYTGIYIRQDLGDKPTNPGGGTCACPDIILCGESDPGPTQFATDTSYGTRSPADVYFNQPNFVYLRGFQANTAQGSNIFLYHVTGNLAMWPQDWVATDVQVGNKQTPQNWAWAPPIQNSPYVVTSEALVWTPKTIDPNVQYHYCTIAWADNSTPDKPIPPDFAQLGYMQSFDNLMYFLAHHLNMGWRNTSDHLTPPPNAEYTTYISTQDSPETVNITVNFNNITDGTFMVNVTGDVSFTSGPTPLNVANYLGGYQVLVGGNGLQFGANQTALLIVTYQTGVNPLSKFASITADLSHVIAGEMLDKMQALASEPGVVLPIKYMAVGAGRQLAVRPVFLLGRQQWNLQFGSAQ